MRRQWLRSKLGRVAGLACACYPSSMIRPKKLPRDPMQRAKAIGDLATGLVEAKTSRVSPQAAQARRKGGVRGGAARAAKLTPERREEIARAAAAARWKKDR